MRISPIAKRPWSAKASLIYRRCVYAVVFAACAWVIWHTIALETFHIPSGSMAPTLLGRHRQCACPRCGSDVVVGRASGDREGTGESRFYRKAFCANCGLYPVPVTQTAERPGDQIVVNKAAYLVRAPSRWEIVVFRLLGSNFIKRILGLPGEEIGIVDGDLQINRKLMRKTLAQARSMRILVFDQTKAPIGIGWKDRWEPPVNELTLRGRISPMTLTYRNFSLEQGKCEPLHDEYAYNAGLFADSEAVHDFLIETEMEATGAGTLSLRLCDGQDWVEVVVPVGQRQAVEAFAWPMASPEQMEKLAETETARGLRAHQRYRVELAFVDRRISLAVDGEVWLCTDLPESVHRLGVDSPFQARADGVEVQLHQFRLYRDVHYGPQGTNAVRGKTVRLSADQYFMLGDNSPNSEDSRFWPDGGRIERASLVGPLIQVR